MGRSTVRKDHSKCMVFFDGLSQDWSHRDSAGRDYWATIRYQSVNWDSPRKIECATVK